MPKAQESIMGQQTQRTDVGFCPRVRMARRFLTSGLVNALFVAPAQAFTVPEVGKLN